MAASWKARSPSAPADALADENGLVAEEDDAGEESVADGVAEVAVDAEGLAMLPPPLEDPHPAASVIASKPPATVAGRPVRARSPSGGAVMRFSSSSRRACSRRGCVPAAAPGRW